jgi:uncharacterized membrane protein YkvA (DUF1232 family)
MSQRRFREVTILVPEDDPAAAGIPGASDTPGAPGSFGSAGSPDDTFPSDRFGALLRRLPRYLRLAWGLAGEPSLPRSRRAAVLGAAVYLASPVDLVPGIIPVVGQLDDVAITILALRAALRAPTSDPAARAHRVGTGPEDLDTDLATVTWRRAGGPARRSAGSPSGARGADGGAHGPWWRSAQWPGGGAGRADRRHGCQGRGRPAGAVPRPGPPGPAPVRAGWPASSAVGRARPDGRSASVPGGRRWSRRPTRALRHPSRRGQP